MFNSNRKPKSCPPDMSTFIFVVLDNIGNLMIHSSYEPEADI